MHLSVNGDKIHLPEPLKLRDEHIRCVFIQMHHRFLRNPSKENATEPQTVKNNE